MFRWELDTVAAEQFDALPPTARRTLAEFLDAAVLVDPASYQQQPSEPDPPRPLRTLPFGPHSEGLVTFLVHPPDDLVLVVRIQWLGD